LGYSFGEENVVRILWNITGQGLHDLHGHWSFFFSDLTIPLDPQTNESSYDKIFSRFKGYALGVCFFFSPKFGGDFRYAVTFQTKPFLAAPIRRQNYVDTGLFEFESLVQFYSVSCACEYVDFLVVSNRYKKN
jgi:hypothetical protein